MYHGTTTAKKKHHQIMAMAEQHQQRDPNIRRKALGLFIFLIICWFGIAYLLVNHATLSENHLIDSKTHLRHSHNAFTQPLILHKIHEASYH